jgi:hypothetical protein
VTRATDRPRRKKKRAERPAREEASSFQRFEDLTRKLVQVPKKELDERRKRAD